MEEKMTLREHFQIALRAVRWTFSIDRRYTLCLFAHALLSAVAPFAAVYFSARVIDALAAGLIAQAALYAALTLGATFLLRAAASAADSVKNTTSAVYFGESWKHAEKAMSMAYGSIESRDVALLRERITRMAAEGLPVVENDNNTACDTRSTVSGSNPASASNGRTSSAPSTAWQSFPFAAISSGRAKSCSSAASRTIRKSAAGSSFASSSALRSTRRV